MTWNRFRRKRHVLIVSDATGKTAEMLVHAALAQFEKTDVETELIPNIRTVDQIPAIFRRASILEGVVIYTFVSLALRQATMEEGMNQGVAAVDIMGPILTRLADLLEISPMAQPGTFRSLNEDYFQRIDAMDYTVKHDDGAGLATLHQADIVLLGISRASKTPLSMYLSYRGWKVANIPLVPGIPLPKEVEKVDPARIIGLTVNPQVLRMIRLERQKHMGSTQLVDYTQMGGIQDEVKAGLQVYRQLGCPVLDTSNKSIEESATQIMRLIYSRGKKGPGKGLGHE